MDNKTLKGIQFWFLVFWLGLTAYLAYHKWPGTYGPEFGDFLVRTAVFGLTPFALAGLFLMARKSISLSLSRREAAEKAALSGGENHRER